MPGNETYLSLEAGTLEGVKHFAVWPLDQAAQSCFGNASWPAEHQIPQSWIEFEVVSLDVASAVLKKQGYQLLVDNCQDLGGKP